MGRIARMDAKNPEPGLLAKATAILEEGGVCVFPTDTVYGIGVLAQEGNTPAKLYNIKKRDEDKAIPLLVGSVDDLAKYSANLPCYAYRLAARFWPGALTLVVKASDAVPPAFRAQDGTVALRMPNNPIALALLSQVRAPLATSSANFQGALPPICPAELSEELLDQVPLVLDGGIIEGGTPSTIISCLEAKPRILREGPLSIQELTQATEAPMKKVQFSYPSANGRNTINALRWEPDDIPYNQVKGVIQIVHGMAEFIDRYDHWARAFVQQGYIVTGNDHLGHGDSVDSPEDWGKIEDPEHRHALGRDVHNLRKMTQEVVGTDVPYIIYGHSMGSFITRSYIAKPQALGLSAAILSGTGHVAPTAGKAGGALASIIGAVKGREHRSTTLNSMAMGAYNKHFEPSKTPVDWLSRDESVCETYVNEPRNSFVFQKTGFQALFALTAEVSSPSCPAKMNPDLPVLFISGAMDPVGDMGKGVTTTYEMFKKAGIKDVTMKLYPEARHELHNELNKEEVFADIIAWLDEHVTCGC